MCFVLSYVSVYVDNLTNKLVLNIIIHFYESELIAIVSIVGELLIIASRELLS